MHTTHTHEYTQYQILFRCIAGDLQLAAITNESATVMWTIPFVSTQQEYIVLYGTSEDTIVTAAGVVSGDNDTTLVNTTYTLEITGLERATTYYVQVVSTFSIYTLYSNIVEFTTQESGKQTPSYIHGAMFNVSNQSLHAAPSGAPVNFTGVPDGLGITFTWGEPPGGLLIDSYTLSCTTDDGSDSFQVQLNPVLLFTVAELNPSTTYVCTISASTTGGLGPESLPVETTTAGRHFKHLTCEAY